MRNSESLKKTNKVRSIYISGNTAIEIEKEEPVRKVRRVKTIKEQREEGLRRQAKKRAERQRALVRNALVVFGAAAFLNVVVLLLGSVITYNSLTKEISTLSSELDALTLQNDSIEYDIDSSVDLNTIIDTATNELGMVRSSSAQIITYSDSESEYIEQVAAIPTE